MRLQTKTEKNYRIVHPDGSIRQIKECAFPVLEQTGVVSRIAGIAEDITYRRQAEEALLYKETISPTDDLCL